MQKTDFFLGAHQAQMHTELKSSNAAYLSRHALLHTIYKSIKATPKKQLLIKHIANDLLKPAKYNTGYDMSTWDTR